MDPLTPGRPVFARNCTPPTSSSGDSSPTYCLKASAIVACRQRQSYRQYRTRTRTRAARCCWFLLPDLRLGKHQPDNDKHRRNAGKPKVNRMRWLPHTARRLSERYSQPKGGSVAVDHRVSGFRGRQQGLVAEARTEQLHAGRKPVVAIPDGSTTAGLPSRLRERPEPRSEAVPLIRDGGQVTRRYRDRVHARQPGGLKYTNQDFVSAPGASNLGLRLIRKLL